MNDLSFHIYLTGLRSFGLCRLNELNSFLLYSALLAATACSFQLFPAPLCSLDLTSRPFHGIIILEGKERGTRMGTKGKTGNLKGAPTMTTTTKLFFTDLGEMTLADAREAIVEITLDGDTSALRDRRITDLTIVGKSLLRKLAENLGIAATGTKTELITKIINAESLIGSTLAY